MLLPHKQALSQSALIEELYQHHWLTLFMAIRQQISSKEEAEDILLEVFLAALENPALIGLSEQQQLAWLRRVASNKCIDYYRRSTRYAPLSSENTVPMFSHEPLSPEEMMLNQEEVGLLRHHLSSLSQIQQQVLVLRFAEELRCAQIAMRLHKSEGAIRTLLSRTLNLLRNLYGKKKGEQHS